jgi:hypothetical protein
LDALACVSLAEPVVGQFGKSNNLFHIVEEAERDVLFQIIFSADFWNSSSRVGAAN